MPPPNKALIVITPRSEATSASQIAQEVIIDSEKLSPPAPGGQGAAPASLDGLTDRWGRAFDPAIHLTDRNGRPAVRGGRTLVTKPGQGRAVSEVQKNKTPQNPAGNIDLPLENQGNEGGQEQNPTETPPSPEIPPLSPEERQAKAASDAEILLEGYYLVGRWFGKQAAKFGLDEHGREERGDILRTGATWLYNDGISLPIGHFTVHAIKVVKYWVRCAETDTGEERLNSIGNFFRGLVGIPRVQIQRRAAAPGDRQAARQETSGDHADEMARLRAEANL